MISPQTAEMKDVVVVAAAPAPPGRRRGRRRLVILAIIVGVLTTALAGGAAIANASLSSTYSASRAVTDYLAAMSRGDVAYMVANGNYPKGNLGPDYFLGPGSVQAMMAIHDNRAIANVRVTGVKTLDSRTSSVTVSMTWAGSERSQTFMAHHDESRRHFLLYHSWLIDMPVTTIKITLPLQPGGVGIDGVYGQAVNTVSVIQGFHSVSMHATDLYDTQTQVVDARDDAGAAAFKAQLSSEAVTWAAEAVRDAFQTPGWKCDPSSIDCLGQRYTAPRGAREILQMDGGDITAYKSWIFTFTGDPTTDMNLVVAERNGIVNATGTCQMQLLVDGGRKYLYHGQWSFTLTWGMNGFTWDGWAQCDQLKG